MNQDTISRLLHDAAGRIAVPSQLEAVIAGAVPVPMRPRRAHRHVTRAAIAAALVAVVAVGVGVFSDDEDGEAVFSAPTPVPADAPAPGEVAPFVASPPAWVGAAGTAVRPAGNRTGRWVQAAFGVRDGPAVHSLITVAAFDGTFTGLDDALPLEVEGVTYRSLRIGSWHALFTTGRPTIMVTGPADADLAVVAAMAHVVDDRGLLTLALDGEPAGYSLVVPPQTLADDTADRPTFAARDGSLSINDVSDSIDPLLYAAVAGVDLRAVDIDGVTGWHGARDGLTFLAWSPQPGVVFEIVTTDTTRSVDDLAALAAATEVMPIKEWWQQT